MNLSKITYSDYKKLNSLGRLLSYIFRGQSCINCLYMVNGVCTQPDHLEEKEIRRNIHLSKITFNRASKDEDLAIWGSGCSEWELVKIDKKEIKGASINSE